MARRSLGIGGCLSGKKPIICLCAAKNQKHKDTKSVKHEKFPNLKPTLKSVSIRLPQTMIDDLKVLANKRDIPYQSLSKMYLAWGIQSEKNNNKLT
ncbi:MAG: CopG family antitoxin [Kiritimatiellae bacterium]|nr:CopG family antitoxin [Kiritimatiellia bacterium]